MAVRTVRTYSTSGNAKQTDITQRVRCRHRTHDINSQIPTQLANKIELWHSAMLLMMRLVCSLLLGHSSLIWKKKKKWAETVFPGMKTESGQDRYMNQMTGICFSPGQGGLVHFFFFSGPNNTWQTWVISRTIKMKIKESSCNWTVMCYVVKTVPSICKSHHLFSSY